MRSIGLKDPFHAALELADYRFEHGRDTRLHGIERLQPGITKGALSNCCAYDAKPQHRHSRCVNHAAEDRSLADHLAAGGRQRLVTLRTRHH
jgi:hypothetical protein